MAEINLMDRYPRAKRANADRAAVTDADRALSRQFGKDYFDGDRKHGYGGYHYHPRFWQETVKRLRDHYQLADNSCILDVGCAKGFMLHDFKQLMPNSTIAGIDVSRYALENAKPDVKPYLQRGNALELPFDNKTFDLVIGINVVHNLELEGCKRAIREIQRVSRKHAFIQVDAWRTEEERKRLEDWILTCRTHMHVDAWKSLFDEVGYTGDYWWFIAEQT